MPSAASPPPEPTERWPAENWLRRAAVVAGVVIFWDVRGPILSFLGFGLVIALVGGYFAQESAERRRRRSEWEIPQSPDEIRRRWAWRVGWAAGLVILSIWLSPGMVVFLTAWWSVGWMLGDYLDWQTPEGRTEWAKWEADKRAWNSGARQRQFESEWRWAAAFDTYDLYRVARTDRPGYPIDDLDYESARRGGKPPPRFASESS